MILRLRLLAAGHGTPWDHWVLIAALYGLIGWFVLGWGLFDADARGWSWFGAVSTCFVWSLAMLECARRGSRWLVEP